jgi:MFS family permease
MTPNSRGIALQGALPSPAVFRRISSFEMLAMFRRGLFYAYLAIYLRHHLGLSVTETTLFATLPMVVNVACQAWVWGPLSDRWQLRRTLIMRGELLAGLGTIAVWVVHTWYDSPAAAGYAVIIGLSLVEIFWSMSNVGWSALISDLYPEASRSAVQGRLASLGGVGRMAGVWSGGLLYDGLGHHPPGWGFSSGALFFVAAAAMFVSIVPMAFTPEGGVGDPQKDRQTAAGGDANGRFFALFLAAMVLINFGRNSIAIIVTQYLVLDSGFALGSRMVSHVVNTQSAAMILTGLMAGRLVRWFGDANTLMVGTIVSCVALLMLSLTDTLGLVFAASFLRGFGDVTLMASSYGLASVLIPPRKRARWFSWFNATFFLSWGLAGTVIAGPVADLMIAAGHGQEAGYRAAFGSALLLTVAGLILMVATVWRRAARISRRNRP